LVQPETILLDSGKEAAENSCSIPSVATGWSFGPQKECAARIPKAGRGDNGAFLFWRFRLSELGRPERSPGGVNSRPQSLVGQGREKGEDEKR